MNYYRVIVSWNDSAVICIEAENATEAAKQAYDLVETGQADYHLDPMNASNFRVDEVQTLANPDDEERSYITKNAEAWADYQENFI